MRDISLAQFLNALTGLPVVPDIGILQVQVSSPLREEAEDTESSAHFRILIANHAKARTLAAAWGLSHTPDWPTRVSVDEDGQTWYQHEYRGRPLNDQGIYVTVVLLSLERAPRPALSGAVRASASTVERGLS